VNSWKVILATLVIFGAGVITGGLLITYSDVIRHTRHEAPRKIASATPAPAHDNRPLISQTFLMRTNFLDRLDRELKLNPDQREHIEKIIREGQQRIRTLSQEIQPRVHATLVETRERINSELTPEQQVLYEELLRHRPNLPRGTNAAIVISPTNSPTVKSNL
jgi:hypothetical protein